MPDLSGLLGGQLPAGLNDMLAKFEQGHHAQVADNQVHDAFGQVAAQLPQDDFVAAAEAAFARLTPEQRSEFAQMLQTKSQQFGLPPAVIQNAPSDPAALASDPAALASATGEVHAQAPNLLQKMFAPGGTFSSPIAKAALLGITAMAAQRLTGSRG